LNNDSNENDSDSGDYGYTSSSPWEGWEEVTEQMLHICGLVEVLPDFVHEPAGTMWLWRELDQAARRFAATVSGYRHEAERAARWRAEHAPQDPQQWKAETPLLEKGKPDTFRVFPKPRDPRRGGERGDHE
jgi:hypothetical protein